MGHHFAKPAEPIPPFMVMVLLIVVVMTVAEPDRALPTERRESRQAADRARRRLEGGARICSSEWIGPKGHRFLPLIATLGVFILLGNYMGLVPGLMAPTSSINVTLGCALTIWVYYHYQGIREHGIGKYVEHFWAPPGAPWWIGFIMFPIEIISHTSRVMSLSLRLFGNIFGEELVILILFSIMPFLVPLPMMFLGLITGGLQAFIFVLLSIIYLQGAVAVEHEHDEHGHDAPHGHHAPAAA